SRESTAHRLELLERAAHSGQAPVPDTVTDTVTVTDAPAEEPVAGPSLELEQLQEAWQRTILPAVEEKSIPTASVLREAHPKGLAGDRLTVEFPQAASFHRQLAEDPKNATLLEEALYEVTGRHLALEFEVGENDGEETGPEADEQPASEEEMIERLKGTFDAREVDPE